MCTLFFKIILFIYLWLCWIFVAEQAFLWFQQQGATLVPVHRLLIVVASLVVAQGGGQASVFAAQGSVVEVPRTQSTGSVDEAHWLSCPSAGGIFLDRGLNPCLLHWQSDSLPLNHQGSLKMFYVKFPN